MYRDQSATVSGSIFAVLFGAVVLLGIMGVGVNMLFRGPVQSMSRVTYYNIAENDIIAATALLSEGSLAIPTADCDLDGMIEPLPFAAPSAGVQAPSGGGHIPGSIGARKMDPWQTPYGYCVWDNGNKALDAACGGATANRRAGGDTQEAYTIAIISAGPDKTFQTTCNDWSGNPADQITKVSGSDDLIRFMPYGQFLLPNKAKAQLDDLPDEACMPQTQGILRMHMGTVQACMDTGWTEVGTAAQTDSNFVDVTNAVLGSEYTSNGISFSGFFGEKTITVEGSAQLIVNGSVVSAPSKVKAGDVIELRASAAAVPETISVFSISVSGVKKTWRIITRNKTPVSLTITPPSATLNVVGPGTPAYSAPAGFIIRNIGESSTLQLFPSVLSPLTNYEFMDDNTTVGDGCFGKVLAHNEDCFVDIRSKSSSEAIPGGALTITDGAHQVSASLNGTASGWACTTPWGTTIPFGGTVTGYKIASACNGSCQSGVRTCGSDPQMGGNPEHNLPSCDNTSMCTHSWRTGSVGSCNASCGNYGTQTVDVYCERQGGTRVADSFCSGAGAKPATSQSCYGGACYSYSWYTGGWSSCPSNCTAGTQTRTVYCRRSDGAQVGDSYCSGGRPSSSATCDRASCCNRSMTCTPYPSGHVCAGSCGGHYVYGTSTWCADTWTSHCLSGCRAVTTSSYSAYCVPN